MTGSTRGCGLSPAAGQHLGMRTFLIFLIGICRQSVFAHELFVTMTTRTRIGHVHWKNHAIRIIMWQYTMLAVTIGTNRRTLVSPQPRLPMRTALVILELMSAEAILAHLCSVRMTRAAKPWYLSATGTAPKSLVGGHGGCLQVGRVPPMASHTVNACPSVNTRLVRHGYLGVADLARRFLVLT